MRRSNMKCSGKLGIPSNENKEDTVCEIGKARGVRALGSQLKNE